MKIDLGEHVGTDPVLVNDNGSIDSEDVFSILVDQIGDTLASFNITIKMLAGHIEALESRINSMERHIGYLLTQDPKVGATIKEHTAKAEELNEPKA